MSVRPSRRSVLLGTVLAASLALPMATSAWAEWPEKPITITVGFGAGGTTDIAARAVADVVSRKLGQPVVVENKPGAGGVIGSEAVARAAPDGNTIVLGHNQTHASNQWMMPNLPYDVIASFTPVARLGTVHHALVVGADAPSHTLAELIERGRREDLSYASSQAGSASHVISETLVRRTGMRAVHVPYRGAAPAATDTMTGVVDFYTATFPSVAPLVRDGKLRALAIGAPARLPDFPDIPTAAEAGQPEPFVDAWFGLFAPAQTPAPLVERIAGAMLGVVRDPSMGEKLRNAGFTLAPQGPAEFAAFQKQEVARWQEMVRLTGVKLEG